VASYDLFFYVNSIIIPCLPTYQSKAFFPYSKLTKSETYTVKSIISSIVIGLKRVSFKAENKVNSGSAIDNFFD